MALPGDASRRRARAAPERAYGVFESRIALPRNADVVAATASYRNVVLVVELSHFDERGSGYVVIV